MKKTILFAFLIGSMAFSLNSCSYRRIGDLTMISTRNIDSKTDYVELRRYVTYKIKLKKNDALEQAIDNAVKGVPGGEFMKNTKIFLRGERKLKIEGDVWGVETKSPQLTDKQQEKLDKKARKAEFEKQKDEIKKDQ